MSPTLIVYWFKLTMKILAKSELFEFWADLGGGYLLFSKKSDFGLVGLNMGFGFSRMIFLLPTLFIYWF